MGNSLKLGQVNQTRTDWWPYGVKSCEGKVATPGLIVCRHLVYGGSCEHEFRERISGCFLLGSSSPRRWNSEHGSGRHGKLLFENLYDKSKRLDYMLRHGVTTVEAKRWLWFGLGNWKRQLDVVAALDRDHQIDLVSTFAGGHAIPTGVQGPFPRIFRSHCGTNASQSEGRKTSWVLWYLLWKGVFTADESHIFFLKLEMGLSYGSMPMNRIHWCWCGGIIEIYQRRTLMVITDEGIQKN